MATIYRDFKLKTYPLLSQLETWREGVVSIPLAQTDVECGVFGLSPEDQAQANLSIDKRFIKNEAASFFFRASGDSMLNVIAPGDYLLVDRSIEANNSQNRVVVADYMGSRIVKFLTTINGKNVLHSFNPKYKDIIITPYDDFSIFGVVTVSFKELSVENLHNYTRF